jgi:hypothetical protein
MEIHLKRKHPLEQQSTRELYRPPTSINSEPYNKPLSIETASVVDSNHFLDNLPSVQQSFSPTFNNISYYEQLENQKRQEKRASQRRFYQMVNEFMKDLALLNNNRNNNNINILMPHSQFPFYNNTIPLTSHFSFIPSITSINTFFDPNPIVDANKMPLGHKIYKCKRCEAETLLPIFDFDNIISSENFKHNCIDDFSKYDNDVEYKGDSYSIYDSLVSIINSRINSEKIILETFVLPQVLIQNPLCLFIFQIIQKVFDLNSLIIPSWILKLLQVEKFIDLGQINYEHWAYLAYDSQDSIIVLEKEELQNIVKILYATFAFVTFEVNNKRKFMFCYIPLSKESIAVG